MVDKFEDKIKSEVNNEKELNSELGFDEKNTIKKLESYICKIYINKTDYENGFLCKIPYPCRSSYINVLITSNKIKKLKLFVISFENDKIKKYIFYDPERKIYKSEKYNLQFIEIFPDKDDIHNFLTFDEDIISEEKLNIKNKNIAI